MAASHSARIPADDHGAAHDSHGGAKLYLMVFGALLVLTAVTVAAAFVETDSEVLKVLIALAIATCKATLVATFFMHLKWEGKLIYLILALPLILTVLMVLALIPDIVYSPSFNEPPPTVTVEAAH